MAWVNKEDKHVTKNKVVVEKIIKTIFSNWENFNFNYFISGFMVFKNSFISKRQLIVGENVVAQDTIIDISWRIFLFLLRNQRRMSRAGI